MGEMAPRAVVLMIDDCPVNIDVVRSTLEPFGYAMVWTHDSRLAIEFARNARPDLVLCDIHMPAADGFAVLTAMKSDPHLRTIPFVLLSATVWPETDGPHGLELGAEKFISRPIDPAALLAEIKDCLRPEG
jgi:CheY-like chemotaxis protein